MPAKEIAYSIHFLVKFLAKICFFSTGIAIAKDFTKASVNGKSSVWMEPN